MSRGDTLSALPIFLPEDPAIPAEEVPATSSFERTMVPDHTILQREQKDAASALTAIAYLVVVLIALALLTFMVWGLHRLAVAVELPTQVHSPAAAGASKRWGQVSSDAGVERGCRIPTPVK